MTTTEAGYPHTLASFDRLLLAFANLESYGFETRILPGTDPRTELIGLQSSIRRAFPAGSACCVFILERDLCRFDNAGNLTDRVPLHHSGAGVARAIGAALDEVGLSVSGQCGPSTVLVTDNELPVTAQPGLEPAVRHLPR